MWFVSMRIQKWGISWGFDNLEPVVEENFRFWNSRSVVEGVDEFRIDLYATPDSVGFLF